MIDFLQHTKAAAHWKRIGIRPHHGICVPLFSLHSNTSCSRGDFGDLFPLIDWCKQVGFDCIQLLPINDTGNELSPYDAISATALDPIYIRIPELASEEILPRHEMKRRKLEWLKKKFEQGHTAQEVKAFQTKYPCLTSYANFQAQKEPDYPNPQFHWYLQFHAFEQMQQVKKYANQHGIFLLGDFPLFLSPDSADVWANPSLFDLRRSAGAPPDPFNRQGQNWGFPLFNWDEMRRTNFSLWRERLKTAEQFFDLYRIDHVMGLFRIWAIPRGGTAFEGHYLPEDPTLWEPQGRELLTMMLDASLMLPIAEDLGTVPPIVPKVLRELGICGTKVIRWITEQVDPLSLTTVSTPDLPTLQLWWQEVPEEAKRFAQQKGWTYHPHLERSQQIEILREANHNPSLFHINLLEEYLALFPNLISPNPEEERINRPGERSDRNWTYRFIPSVQEIVEHRELAEEIKRMIH